MSLDVLHRRGKHSEGEVPPASKIHQLLFEGGYDCVSKDAAEAMLKWRWFFPDQLVEDEYMKFISMHPVTPVLLIACGFLIFIAGLFLDSEQTPLDYAVYTAVRVVLPLLLVFAVFIVWINVPGFSSTTSVKLIEKTVFALVLVMLSCRIGLYSTRQLCRATQCFFQIQPRFVPVEIIAAQPPSLRTSYLIPLAISGFLMIFIPRFQIDPSTHDGYAADTTSHLIAVVVLYVVAATLGVILSVIGEQKSRQRFVDWVAVRRQRHAVERHKERIDALVNIFISEKHLHSIIKQEPAIDFAEQCSVAVCCIHDFDRWSAQLAPPSVPLLVDSLYSSFDAFLKSHPLCQLTAVTGDSYTITVGLRGQIRKRHSQQNGSGGQAQQDQLAQRRQKNPKYRVLELLDFCHCQLRAAEWVSSTFNMKLAIGIGVATGSCAGGIFGSDALYYGVGGPAEQTARDIAKGARLYDSIAVDDNTLVIAPAEIDIVEVRRVLQHNRATLVQRPVERRATAHVVIDIDRSILHDTEMRAEVDDDSRHVEERGEGSGSVSENWCGDVSKFVESARNDIDENELERTVAAGGNDKSSRAEQRLADRIAFIKMHTTEEQQLQLAAISGKWKSESPPHSVEAENQRLGEHFLPFAFEGYTLEEEYRAQRPPSTVVPLAAGCSLALLVITIQLLDFGLKPVAVASYYLSGIPFVLMSVAFTIQLTGRTAIPRLLQLLLIAASTFLLTVAGVIGGGIAGSSVFYIVAIGLGVGTLNDGPWLRWWGWCLVHLPMMWGIVRRAVQGIIGDGMLTFFLAVGFFLGVAIKERSSRQAFLFVKLSEVLRDEAAVEFVVLQVILDRLLPRYIVPIVATHTGIRGECIADSLPDVALLAMDITSSSAVHPTTWLVAMANLLEGALKKLDSVEARLVRVHGDRVLVAGPLRQPPKSDMIRLASTVALKGGGPCEVSQARELLTSQTSAALLRMVRYLSDAGRGTGDATPSAMTFHLTAVLVRGDVMTVVLGNEQPRFDLIGAIVQQSVALLDAAPTGSITAADCFHRVEVHSANMYANAAHHPSATDSTPPSYRQAGFTVDDAQRWSTKYAGVVKVYPLHRAPEFVGALNET